MSGYPDDRFDDERRPDPRAIEEARLFWADGWLHLLAARRQGTRWAAFREHQAPGWLSPSDSKMPQSAIWDVVRRRDGVLLLRDWHRYGLRGQVPPGLAENYRVSLYPKESSLVGWKLEEAEVRPS